VSDIVESIHERTHRLRARIAQLDPAEQPDRVKLLTGWADELDAIAAEYKSGDNAHAMSRLEDLRSEIRFAPPTIGE
jgi:hypothetical protein